MYAKYITAFEARQEMARDDYEIFHRLDSEPCNVAPHTHGFFELYCLLGSEMDYMVDGLRYHLAPGSLLLIPPGALHRPDWSGQPRNVERIVLWLNRDFIASLTRLLPRLRKVLDGGLNGGRLIAPDDENCEAIQAILFSMLREVRLGDADSAYMCRLLATQLLVYLGRLLAQSSEPMRYRAELRYGEAVRVYEYISAHLREELSVAGLAERFFMDKNTLTRQFKRLTGMTPGECIRLRRLETAHAMIRQGASMKQACAECGFSDYSAFYRAFRQVYGVSPSAYAEEVGSGQRGPER